MDPFLYTASRNVFGEAFMSALWEMVLAFGLLAALALFIYVGGLTLLLLFGNEYAYRRNWELLKIIKKLHQGHVDRDSPEYAQLLNFQEEGVVRMYPLIDTSTNQWVVRASLTRSAVAEVFWR